MKREDIKYFNSWAKCFGAASPAIVMDALVNGIWINSNKDPEDIYKVYPRLIAMEHSEWLCKKFSMCPFEFAIDDCEKWDSDGIGHKKGDYIQKGRFIKDFGRSWHTDVYEMRKAVTKQGLEIAKRHNITEEDIKALFDRFGYDDAAAYNELRTQRHDLNLKREHSESDFWAIDLSDYKYIRAAFIPHCNTLYNWMDYPEKAGIDYPDIDHR